MILEYCNYLLYRLILTTCGVAVVEIIGIDGLSYQVLFILVFIDFLSGLMVAWRQKEVSSRGAAQSVPKLILYFLLVLAAHQIVRLTGYAKWIEDAVVMYLAVTEFISITENASKLGVPVPLWIKEKLLTYIENGYKKN